MIGTINVIKAIVQTLIFIWVIKWLGKIIVNRTEKKQVIVRKVEPSISTEKQTIRQARTDIDTPERLKKQNNIDSQCSNNINFEENFLDLQASMVSLCLEYVENKANYLYIYAASENNLSTFNVFYNVNNSIVNKNQINDALGYQVIDDSKERTLSLLKYGNEDWKALLDFLKANNKDIPTEMKIIYDVKENKMTTRFKYDFQLTNSDTMTHHDILMSWYEEIKSEHEDKKKEQALV